VLLMLALAYPVSAHAAGAHAALTSRVAVVSGVVRDSQGIPQMGAMVQAIGADAAVVATAFTDIHGKYLLGDIEPGSYQIKATAAMFCRRCGTIWSCMWV
jgi:hypothetical protein